MKKNLIDSFKHAIEGIASTFKTERNFKIHVLAAILVIVSGIIFKINITEWIICIACIGAVMSAEAFNTAIENTVDLACKNKNEKAKLAKDTSAGAVLILALASLIIGLIIFIPKLLNILK